MPVDMWNILNLHIPGKRSTSPKGWTQFNAVCCHHRGHRPDVKGRAGLMQAPDGSVVYHCFNCKYATIWKPGTVLSNKMKTLMSYIGVSEQKIREINFQCWTERQRVEQTVQQSFPDTYTLPKYNRVELPRFSRTLSQWLEEDNLNPDLCDVLEYVIGRGSHIFETYDFYWTPLKERGYSRRIIIPLTWFGNIVGYTARHIEELKPKYLNQMPSNFIFNNHILFDYTKTNVFLCEGPFDAMAIGGISCLGNEISKEQLQLIQSSGKDVTVVPDRDQDGQNLIDIALENGWYVAFPRGKWPDSQHVKDAADAVNRFGRLYTIWTIMNNRTKERLKIQVERKFIRSAKR